MDLMLTKVDPLIAIILMGGVAGMTWLAKRIEAKDVELRADREKYMTVMQQTTEVMSAFRVELKTVAENTDKMVALMQQTLASRDRARADHDQERAERRLHT